MASATISTYTSTPESHNFAKVCRLFVDLLRDVLWEALTKRILPKDIPENVRKNKSVLETRGKMTEEQYKKICKPGGEEVSFEDFDISLLYILLRHLPMNPEIQGWAKDWGSDVYPDEKHTREANDIERIRIKRNQFYVHAGRASLSQDEFDKFWTDMEVVVERFDRRFSTNLKSEMEVILKDDKFEEEYINDLKNQKEYDLERRQLALEAKKETAKDKEAATKSSEKIKKQSAGTEAYKWKMEHAKDSKYISTPESWNFVRVCRLFVELLRDVLWEALTKRILPDDLPEIVRRNKAMLELAGRMTDDQYRRICKPDGMNVSFEDFDISLLYILLRYLPMKPKIQGSFKSWGSDDYPDEKHIRETDDIERIRIKRNQLYVHAGRASLSKDEFDKFWTDMEAVVERFDLRLSTNLKREMEVILKDDKFEEEYINDFKYQKEYDLERRQLALEAKKETAKDKETATKSSEKIKNKEEGIERKIDDPTVREKKRLPPEILRMDKRSQQLYREALEDGKENVYNIRVMIVGHLGVGKTTLTKRLLDENAVEAPRVSTEGIEVHPRCCKIDLDTKEWIVEKKEHRFPDNGQLLVNVVCKHVANKNMNSHDVSQEETNDIHIFLTNTEQDMKADIQQEGINNTSFGGSIPVALEAKGKMSKSDVMQTYTNVASVNYTVDVGEEHSIHDKQNLLDPDRYQYSQNDSNETISIGGVSTGINDTRSHSDFHDFVTKYGTLTHSGKAFCYVTMLDFAGQFIFYTTHQTFMSWRTIYLLVTDMSKSLDDLVEEDKCSLNLNRNMESSIKDYAVYWLNSIYSHGMPTDTSPQCEGSTQRETENNEESLNGAAKYPSVILVGTHLDKVPEGRKDKKNEYFDSVRRILKDRPQRFLLKGYFAISNFGPDTDIDALKHKILELAQKQDYWGEEIPARWLALEQKLMELKRSGVKIIEYRLVEKINTSSDVKIENQDELEVFLRFEHDLGNIVYFNTEKLRDKIVLDPDWLIDGVRVLISPSLHVIEDNPEIHPQWYSFLYTGQLTKPLIDLLWSEGKHKDFHKNRDHLLDLMEKLSIIARPVAKDRSVEDQKHSYWVPCVIYKSAPDHVKNPKPCEGMTRTSTLCFVSKMKFIHVGVFHRLVASFLSKWPPAEEDGEFHLYSGCCEFEVDNRHTLLLVHNDYAIAATMFRSSNGGKCPDNGLCSNIRNLISSTLADISACISPNSKFDICVKCERSSTDTIKGLLAISDRDEIRCKCSKPAHSVKVENLLKFWEQKTDPVEEGHLYSQTSYLTRHMECQVSLWRRALPPEKKYHVFFSYSSSDIQWVKKTVEKLEKDHGFVCCEYDRDNTPGTSLLQFASDSIKNAYKTVVVMTREAFQSGFVVYEIEMAIIQGFQERRKCVVPVFLEDCEIPSHLSILNYVDARDPKSRDIWWPKLLTELET